MRRLLAAALFGLAVCAARAEEPAAMPDAAAAQAADMEKVRAVLRQMQSQSNVFNVPLDRGDGGDVVVAAPPPKKPLFEVTDGPAGPAKPIGPQLDDNSAAGRRRRSSLSNSRVVITPQLKEMGIDTGNVDVGVGGHGVVFSVPF